ncbi:hypothetical protein, partial [Rhizobium sp.]|uniref:hypothetical protein n=1 Tax=Rhizobium sp. TaxID=391 RepID=UPI002AA634EB
PRKTSTKSPTVSTIDHDKPSDFELRSKPTKLKYQSSLLHFNRETAVAKKIKGGDGRSVADALILEPNFAGVGVDIKKLLGYFFEKRSA